jgi:hypothetical protein
VKKKKEKRENMRIWTVSEKLDCHHVQLYICVHFFSTAVASDVRHVGLALCVVGRRRQRRHRPAAESASR